MMGRVTSTSSYFHRIADGRYLPTERTGGAWNDGEIHVSPLGGLIAHVMELHRANTDDGKELARISFDILGFLAAEECVIRVETIRPGRTVELVEAEVTIAGRVAIRARAWFLSGSDTRAIAGGHPDPMPTPDETPLHSMTKSWPGGYVASLEVRATDPQPGRARAWLRSDTALVAEEDSSALANFIALVDTANGVSPRLAPDEWLFPNLDLTIHFHTQPRGPWVGLDMRQTVGPGGHGLTSSTLHDETGPVGQAEQILTVRPR
jgi:acyl-CoA thioesterase